MEKADYMRHWRTTPAGRAAMIAQKRREKAARRAWVELAKNHEEEYDELFMAHLIELEREARDGQREAE